MFIIVSLLFDFDVLLIITQCCPCFLIFRYFLLKTSLVLNLFFKIYYINRFLKKFPNYDSSGD
jgi:hypothetical protein